MLGRIKEVFREHRKKFSAIFWIAVATLIILGPVFLKLVPGEISMFAIVLILLAYLEIQGRELRDERETLVEEILENIEKGLLEPSVYKNQVKADIGLVKFINSEKPRKADLLEYSTVHFWKEIEILAEIGSRIRLLIKNPKKTISNVQENRICAQIRHLSGLHKANLNIRCYNQRASLRGRKFDDKLINVGWYTFDIRSENPPEIWGHSNPLFTLKEGRKGYEKIANFFDTVFENLWKKATPLKEVAKNCDKDCYVKDRMEWLDRVS